MWREVYENESVLLSVLFMILQKKVNKLSAEKGRILKFLQIEIFVYLFIYLVKWRVC